MIWRQATLSAKAWPFLVHIFSYCAILQCPILKIRIFLGHPTWQALDSSSWFFSHMMLSKVLLGVLASLLPGLESAISPEEEQLQALGLPSGAPFSPVRGLLILHSCVNRQMPPDRWFYILCSLYVFPYWEDGCELSSLHGPPPISPHCQAFFFFCFFLHISGGKMSLLLSKASPYLCDLVFSLSIFI